MIGKICIISEGITGLILSKVLLDLGIKIDLVNSNFFKKNIYGERTVAISNHNFLFLKKNKILNLKKKDFCLINEIKIFNTKFKKPNDSILKFSDKKKPIFYVMKNKTIFLKKGEIDSRQRHIFLDEKGKKLFEEIFFEQKKRIYNALKKLDSDSVIKFKNVLNKIINE